MIGGNVGGGGGGGGGGGAYMLELVSVPFGSSLPVLLFISGFCYITFTIGGSVCCEDYFIASATIGTIIRIPLGCDY